MPGLKSIIKPHKRGLSKVKTHTRTTKVYRRRRDLKSRPGSGASFAKRLPVKK